MQKRIHYFSGIVIASFVMLHLANHLISLSGAANHIRWMELFRQIYRNPLVESLLLLAIGIQILSGLRLFLLSRKTVKGFFQQLQRWSGLYLALFFLNHIGAVFAGRYFLEVDTNLYFGIAGLHSFPHALFFFPYYSLAILAFFGHVSSIHARKMTKDIFGLSPKQQAYGVLLLGVLTTMMILLGLTNFFEGFAIPDPYSL